MPFPVTPESSRPFPERQGSLQKDGELLSKDGGLLSKDDGLSSKGGGLFLKCPVVFHRCRNLHYPHHTHFTALSESVGRVFRFIPWSAPCGVRLKT